MKRLERTFIYHHPLRQKIVRDLSLVTEHIGDLVIEAKGYFNPEASPIDVFDRYGVDLDFVRWNGTDIRPVLEVTGQLHDIEEAAVRYFAQLLESGTAKAA